MLERGLMSGLLTIKNTSGKKDKINLLREFCSTSILHDFVARFLLDDRIVTGLDLKKINNKKVAPAESSSTLVDVITYLQDNNTGSNSDIAFVKGYLNLLDSDMQKFYASVFTRTLSLGVGVKGYNEAFPNNKITLFECMKGHLYDSSKFAKSRLKYGKRFAITNKVDGNRATLCREGVDSALKLISPNGREHTGYDHILAELDKLFGGKYFVDGELEYYDETGTMTHDEIRQKTTSICSSNAKEKTEIKFKIFHVLPLQEWESEKLTTKYFEMRDSIMGAFDCSQYEHISFLPLLYDGEDESVIVEIFKEQRSLGKEGIIINFDAPYTPGKKDALLKLKDVLDFDLKVVGYEFGKEGTRLEHTLGALVVELEVNDTVYKVSVGGGLTDAFRKEFIESPEDYLNRVAEIVATEVSKNKDGGYSLSYPRFIAFRDKTIVDVDRISLS